MTAQIDMSHKAAVLTGDAKSRFLKLIQADVRGGLTIISPLLLITTSKSDLAEHMIVVPIQFDEHGVKTEFKKLKGSLLELYMTLPRAEIISDDPELGPRTEIYLTEAFKNEPDDIAVGVEFKNGLLWAWIPKSFINNPKS